MADEIKAIAGDIAETVLGGDFDSINIDDGDVKDDKAEENGTAQSESATESVADKREKENEEEAEKGKEKPSDGGRGNEDRDKENGESRARGDGPRKSGEPKGGSEGGHARDGRRGGGGGGGEGRGGGERGGRSGQERKPGGGDDGRRRNGGRRDPEKAQGNATADPASAASTPGPVERAKTALKDRKCLTKLAIGVGLGLLLLVVVIVVAVVVPGSSEPDGVSSESPPPLTDAARADDRTTTRLPDTTTRYQGPRPLELTSLFQVRLGEGNSFVQSLAVHPTSRQYVLVITDDAKAVYVILDFRARMRTVLGVSRDSEAEVTSRIVEGSVLFCHETRFSVDFTGDFLDDTALERSNDLQYTSVSGRNTTIVLTKQSSTLILPSVVTLVFSGSCSLLPAEAFIHWDGQSACSDVNVSPPQVPSTCPATCPRFSETVSSVEGACSKYQTCNALMGRCDPFFTEQQFTGRPYCTCRNALASDVRGVRCLAGDDQCQARQRAVEQEGRAAPCYCKYRISHVNPYVPGGAREASRIAWLFDSYRITAVSKTFGDCAC